MIMERLEIFTNLIKCDENTDEFSAAFATDLKNGALSFLELTEHFGSFLTNTDLVVRRGGTESLSTILMELPTDYLKSEEIKVLAKFYCDRMLDHHSIVPAVLKGFLALLKMEHLPPGIASKMFTVMNLHFVNQSQTQPDRFLCYEIFNTMVLKNPNELQALGPDFVCGYLTAIDSERDPRNLMYLFDNLPHFFRTFSPGHLMEDAFEAVSCYFPIDFRANPNDPRGISRDDLSRALSPCLTSIPEFIPFVIPLALEKLSSDLQVAKMDSLSLLKECFSNFSNDSILRSHSTETISALLQELKFDTNKEDLRERIVQVLIVVIKYITNHGENEDLLRILDEIFGKVHHCLNDIRLNVFLQAVEFLTQISYASPSASRFFAIKMIPKLLTMDISSPQHAVNLLRSLKSLLLSCIRHNISCAEVPELQHLWHEIPCLFLRQCESDNLPLKSTAVEGCTSVIRLMEVKDRRLFYDILCKNILLETDTDLSLQCMKCLARVAENYPEEVHDAITSKFRTSNVKSAAQQRRITRCFCILATLPNFVIYLDETIKQYVRADSFEFADFVIESLKDTVISERKNYRFLCALHYKINVVQHLINWWHGGCNAIGDDVVKVYEDEQIAKNLQLVVSIIVGALEKEAQQEIANYYFQLTLEYSKRFMNSFAYLNDNNDLDLPNVHCSLSIITFESVVNGLLPAVLEESFKTCLTQIIKYLYTLSIYCSRTLCRLVACRSIATIFNKMPQSSNLEKEISYVLSYIGSVISTKSIALKNNSITLHLYVTKALLLRGYTNLNAWCDHLVELLRNEQIGNDVALGVKLILSENEYFLNSSCHCTIKLFYPQRIFSYVIPKLVDLYQSSDSVVRKRCAVSTLYLLNGVPQVVIQRYFNKLVPLLIESLEENSDTALTYEALQKLVDVLKSNPSLFENYTETFIPKLLKLSYCANQMNIRIVALECLYNYSKLNVAAILPFKSKVLVELASCLDDKKRLVRKTAVKTRTYWFIVGAS